MNHLISGFHYNILQSLLYRYSYSGDHSYWYFRVPWYLYASCSSLTCGDTYKPHSWGIYHWNRFICIHVIFCEYNHWLVVRSLFYHSLVWFQGHFCQCILHVISSPLLCGFVLLLQCVTLPHHTFWPVPYYDLVLQSFGSPPVYHVSYISLWSKDFSVRCNLTVLLIMIPTSTFWTFLWPTLLMLPLLQSCVLTCQVVTQLILRWNKFFVD